MPVAYSKNKPQYAFLAALVAGVALLLWAVGGVEWAAAFLVLLPFSAIGFTGFHRRRTP